MDAFFIRVIRRSGFLDLQPVVNSGGSNVSLPDPAAGRCAFKAADRLRNVISPEPGRRDGNHRLFARR